MGLLAAPGRRPAAGAAPLCFVALICDYFHKLRRIATAGHAPGASPREGRLHAQLASIQQEAGQFKKMKNFNALMKFETPRVEKGGEPWGNRKGRKSGEGVVEIGESQINQDVTPGKTKCASLRRKMGQNATPCTPAAGPRRSRAKPWEIATNVARFQRKCIPFPALAVWAARAVVGEFGKRPGAPDPGAAGSRPRRASRRRPRDAASLPDVPPPVHAVGRMQATSGMEAATPGRACGAAVTPASARRWHRCASPRVRGRGDAFSTSSLGWAHFLARAGEGPSPPPGSGASPRAGGKARAFGHERHPVRASSRVPARPSMRREESALRQHGLTKAVNSRRFRHSGCVLPFGLLPLRQGVEIRFAREELLPYGHDRIS